MMKWLLLPAALLGGSLASIRMHGQTVMLGYRLAELRTQKAKIEQEVLRQQCRLSAALSPVQVFRKGKDLGLRIEASAQRAK